MMWSQPPWRKIDNSVARRKETGSRTGIGRSVPGMVAGQSLGSWHGMGALSTKYNCAPAVWPKPGSRKKNA